MGFRDSEEERRKEERRVFLLKKKGRGETPTSKNFAVSTLITKCQYGLTDVGKVQ